MSARRRVAKYLGFDHHRERNTRTEEDDCGRKAAGRSEEQYQQSSQDASEQLSGATHIFVAATIWSPFITKDSPSANWSPRTTLLGMTRLSQSINPVSPKTRTTGANVAPAATICGTVNPSVIATAAMPS